MKKILTIIALLFYSLSFSQIVSRSDAWSGIITDNSGNPLENTNIILKFTYTNNGITTLYSEQHNKTTDSNGFVTANIGQGTVLQNGSSLRYTISNLKLKVEVDAGSGFVTLSDDYPKAVPFSNAATYAGELTDGFSTIFFNTANYQVNIDANQEIILGASGEVQGEINENGLKLNDLAGTGIREVVANANGQLQRKPVQTKYLSISGADFSNSEFIFYPPYYGLIRTSIASGSSVNISTPINLPHNVKITSIKFVYLDNSSTRGFIAGIYATNSTPSNNLIVGLNTDTTPNSNAFQIVNTPSFSYTIDNLNNYYFLNISSTNWQNNFDLVFQRIVITYEE